MGFDGKTLIHPGQIEPCNDTWAPSAEAIEDARALIATFEEAMAEGKGVVTHNGRMVENLHVETARRVLAVAAAIEASQA
jgi:citrate lyase subunit beta/citryl-CoA lyase